VRSDTVTLIVLVPEPVTEPGLKETLAPDGNPLTCSATFPVKPEPPLTVTVYRAVPPGRTVRDAGAADIEKSETVTVRVAGCWFVLPVLSVTVSDATCVPGAE
jgi:hypothetical protein